MAGWRVGGVVEGVCTEAWAHKDRPHSLMSLWLVDKYRWEKTEDCTPLSHVYYCWEHSVRLWVLLLVCYETGEVPLCQSALSLLLLYSPRWCQTHVFVYFQHLLSKLRPDCTKSCDLSNPTCSKVDMTGEQIFSLGHSFSLTHTLIHGHETSL